MWKSVLSCAAAALVLTSCASAPKMSAEQCSSMDWGALGKKDGETGQNMTALNDEITMCAAHGIKPDMDAYNAGRNEGLKSYCKPVTLLDATIQGVGDPYSCEPLSADQKKSFETGRETRAAVAKYQQLKQQYDQLIQQRQRINQEGAQLTQQYNQTTDETARQQIAQRINYLRQALAQTEEKIKQADPVMKTETATYETAVKKYEAYKATLAR
jgi:hypothetical protein